MAKILDNVVPLSFAFLIIGLTLQIFIHSLRFPPVYRVCKSIEVKTVHDLQKLQDCDIVDGHVIISSLNITEQKYQSSEIFEITDYLLVYRVDGLQSLQELFPYLEVIRGKQLFFNKYSLIVYENVNLENLGLTYLLQIQRGSILIESNPILCFVETVNWVQLLENKTTQYFTLKNNKPQNNCPVCVPNNSNNKFFEENCWSLHIPQKKIPKTCSNLDNEYANEKCCENDCLSGCSASGCRVCKRFTLNGTCVAECNIPHYQFNQRECITQDECMKMNQVLYKGSCLEECPKYSKQIMDQDQGITSCQHDCSGTFKISTKEDLYQLKHCTTIKGSLIIKVEEATSSMIPELDAYLGVLTEITGYLQVTRSPQLVSLEFFRNLDAIKGEELLDGRYVLSVTENYNLEGIWAPNQEVALFKGTINFHMNPKLCYSNIMHLKPSIKTSDEIRLEDVPQNTNGDRVVCDFDNPQTGLKHLEVTLEDFNATAIRLRYKPLDYVNEGVHIGYYFYFKETKSTNISRYDGRHGCGFDKWLMLLNFGRFTSQLISHFTPYTQYAYFVRTMGVSSHHHATEGYSPVKYFKTLPSKPGKVSKIYYEVISDSQMIIHWWPPRHLNGEISKYYLSYKLWDKYDKDMTTAVSSLNTTKSLISNCNCPKNFEDEYGAAIDFNNLNVAQMLYHELLPDIIYKNRTGKNSIENSYQSKRDLADYFGIRNTNIIKSAPACTEIDEIESKEENNVCEIPEIIDGIEIPGNIYEYQLSNLRRKKQYEITIRACVSGLANGCGREKRIIAKI